MALLRYDPWSLINQVQEINRLFDNRTASPRDEDSGHVVASDWVPAVDIKEEQNRYVILADVPGVDPASIEITMENGVLTLRGERKLESEEERAGYRRVERVRGSFYRRFTLPDSVDPEGITARGDNGVLEIVIPKHEKLQPRRIQVNG
ncbi:MAG: Hsp20/alpha crystallin family protein [Proteobacteria bacterium]|nr:MAG: Hsp20/alpha crystallin family protein [Pseudomonadota bacterium]QKK11106.1 MAG: Hsp20/alpha crystallin family protein [Pseudomonadota bacterium]